VKLQPGDDWLEFETSPEQVALQELLMGEEEIRVLNSDFNFKHYGQFYEAIEKKEGKRETLMASESNLFNAMWNKVQLDPAVTANYEQWLEEEVWTYFD
jgi:hypothetical protein